jgi:hypothetical protein
MSSRRPIERRIFQRPPGLPDKDVRRYLPSALLLQQPENDCLVSLFRTIISSRIYRITKGLNVV